jgi:hypothetical protein
MKPQLRSNRRVFVRSVSGAAACLASAPAMIASRARGADEATREGFIRGSIIWDRSRITDRKGDRIEFPSLVRFKDHWYCAFREAVSHDGHPSGRGRLIRSADGATWETVRLFTWDGGDFREPKFSITPEGMLMINTSVYFVSKEPGADGHYYQLERVGTTLNLVEHDREPYIAQQSMTWLSADGVTWSSAYACPSGANTWLWDTTWYNGMGYSIAEWGKHMRGALYRTRDGKNWRLLKDAFLPDGQAGEGALAFGPDGTAYCLLRGDSKSQLFLGLGKSPYYQDWEWKRPKIDYGPKHGAMRPVEEMLRFGVGGPKLVRLKDGRLVGAGRVLGPGRDDGHVTLFWVDPREGNLTVFAEMDGTSYPGVVEHDGMLWVTFIGSACHQNTWEVQLAKLKIH